MRLHIILILAFSLLSVGFVQSQKVSVDVLVYWQGENSDWKGSMELNRGILSHAEGYHWENQFESQLPHRDQLLSKTLRKVSWKSHTEKGSDGLLFTAQLDAGRKITVQLNEAKVQVTPNELLNASPHIPGIQGDARVILLSLKRPKERRDIDGDGDPDELIIDETARRGPGRSGEFSSPQQAAKCSLFPIALKVVDDDDDMSDKDIIGDNDSDCYIADYDADGTVDRLLDWIDNDGDGDADEMDLRYYRNGELVWGWFWEDLDDDNKMWSVANYEYREAFSSDVYGDNIFWLQKYNPLTNSWLPYSECPFSFYDLDHDGFSEAVIRVSAVPGPENNANSYGEIWGPNPTKPVRVSNIRYSFDIDNDSTKTNQLDYDFGFTLVGSFPYEGFSYTNPLRRPPKTVQRIPHKDLRALADNYPADLTGFSWDEFDRNHRWEGIFWSEQDWIRFPLANAGGPSYRWNMRREFVNHPQNQRQVYFSEVDQRIHCFGAELGWIEHGHMWSDEKIAETKFFDTNNDGFFDRWELNLDNKGSPERVITNAQRVQMLPWDYEDLHRFYVDLLPKVIEKNQQIIAAIRRVGLTAADTISPKAVLRLEKHLKTTTSQERFRSVTDLLREYYTHALLVRLDQTIAATNVPQKRMDLQSLRDQLGRTSGQGYTDGVLAILDRLPNLPKSRRRKQKNILVRITNPLDVSRTSAPVVLRLEDLPKDFGAGPFRVIDAEGRVLPSQLDDHDGDSLKDEIFFAISLGPHEMQAVTIRYGDMDAQQAYQPRVYAQVGQKFYLAWESDLAAFRSYFGKTDVFGKTKPCLFLREKESPWINTHEMTRGGMDILNVGPTSGLGGLNVWYAGKPFQVDSYGAPGKREIRSEAHFRILAEGPVRTYVEIMEPRWKVGNRLFQAHLRATIWAGCRDCRIQIKIRSHDGQPFDFGPGMTIVGEKGHVDTDRRILWCWGDQKIHAGEIGLGLLYPSDSLQSVEQGKGEMLLRYRSDGESAMEMAIAGGWTRDGRFHNPDEWFAYLKQLRREIDNPVQVELIK